MPERINPKQPKPRTSRRAAFSLVLVTACVMPAFATSAASCASETKPNPKPVEKPVVVTPPAYGKAWDKLSDWHLFRDPTKQTLADGVVAYDVISPLFTDYTTKFRDLWIPDGSKIEYTDDWAWQFPVGTVLVKTFSYHADYRDPASPLRLLETRILWHQPDGWTVHTYKWNTDQSDAVSVIAGDHVPADFIDPTGASIHNDYYIPNTNECQECHTKDKAVGPNGTKTRQLDRDHDYGAADGGVQNQIEHMKSLGLFSAEPTAKASRVALVDPMGDASLDLRARSYLDANCSSCHAKGGYASQSSLLLDFPSTDPATNTQANWGVCKVPTSQGGATCNNQFDIVPGQPDKSILLCRFTTTESKWRMPPLGVQLLHQEGIDLMRTWIQGMSGTCM